MKDKKHMIIIGIVILVVVLGVVMTIFFLNRNKTKNIESEGKKTEAGIHYGGNFNEFEYIPEETTGEKAEYAEEEETVNLTEVAAEAEKIKEEFEREKPGDVILENDSPQGKNENSAALNSVRQENNKEQETNQEGNAGPVETMEGGIPILRSEGYAEHEVLCDAQTREEAEQIAGQIAGTLISWEHGVATIEIAGSVDDLLAQLEQQGSTLELYRNYYYSIP